MSDSEGEVKADPFGGWVMDGDLVEEDCEALVSRSPCPSVCPCPTSLELFRWNKRISESEGGFGMRIARRPSGWLPRIRVPRLAWL